MSKSFFFIAFTAFTLPVFAQQNAIKITPLQPLIGKFSAQYERQIGLRSTVVVEYQRWMEHRSEGVGLFVFGIFASSSSDKTNNGDRVNVLFRRYNKLAMDGFFVEGGAYLGRHDIKIKDETSIFNPFAILTLNLGDVVNETVKEQHYKVTAYGARAGFGWHHVHNNLSLEFSAGLSLNGNSAHIHPTLGMKPVSPYTRMAVGVSF